MNIINNSFLGLFTVKAVSGKPLTGMCGVRIYAGKAPIIKEM